MLANDCQHLFTHFSTCSVKYLEEVSSYLKINGVGNNNNSVCYIKRIKNGFQIKSGLVQLGLVKQTVNEYQIEVEQPQAYSPSPTPPSPIATTVDVNVDIESIFHSLSTQLEKWQSIVSFTRNYVSTLKKWLLANDHAQKNTFLNHLFPIDFRTEYSVDIHYGQTIANCKGIEIGPFAVATKQHAGANTTTCLFSLFVCHESDDHLFLIQKEQICASLSTYQMCPAYSVAALRVVEETHYSPQVMMTHPCWFGPQCATPSSTRFAVFLGHFLQRIHMASRVITQTVPILFNDAMQHTTETLLLYMRMHKGHIRTALLDCPYVRYATWTNDNVIALAIHSRERDAVGIELQLFLNCYDKTLTTDRNNIPHHIRTPRRSLSYQVHVVETTTEILNHLLTDMVCYVLQKCNQSYLDHLHECTTTFATKLYLNLV